MYGRKHMIIYKQNMAFSNVLCEELNKNQNSKIHKKEDGSYYVVSANKASSVTL